MFVINNILHLDINVMPIGALAATFITTALISFALTVPSPLSDPDDDKDKKKQKKKEKKKNVNSIFYNYFVKPVVTTFSVWIICWVAMALWGFVPDDFWTTTELTKDIIKKQSEIDALAEVASEQDKVIKEQISKLRTIGHVLILLKIDYPHTYAFLSKFFRDNADSSF